MSLQSQPLFQLANFLAYLTVPNHWQGRGIGFVQSFHMRVKVIQNYFLKMQYKLKVNSNNFSQKNYHEFQDLSERSTSFKDANFLTPIEFTKTSINPCFDNLFKMFFFMEKNFPCLELMKFKIVTKLCLSHLLFLSRKTSILYSFNRLCRRT